MPHDSRVCSALSRWLCTALALLAAHGCSEPAPAASGARLSLRFGGCADVLEGSICELAEGAELVLFVPGSDDAPRAVLDGAPLELAWERMPRGVRARLAPPPDARALELTRGESVATLRLTRERPLPELVAARAARARGALDEARGALAPLLASSDPIARVRARSLSARLALSAGDAEAAIEGLAEAAAEARALGRRASAGVDAITRAELLRSRLHRLGDARRALATITPDDAHGAFVGILVHYHSALLARDLHDLRGALRHLDEATERALEVSDTGMARDAGLVRSTVLVALGRAEEAHEALRALLQRVPPADDCERAADDQHLAWALLARGRVAEAERALAEAHAIYGEVCPHPEARASVAVDLALSALSQGALDRASRWLEEVSATSELSVARAWRLELAARLALARGDHAAALAHWTEAEARARAVGASGLAYLALSGRGRALWAAGRASEAIDALTRAEAELDRAVALVPLGEGRDTFLAQNGEGTRLLVDALVAQGRERDALHAARRARRRALVTIARGLFAEAALSREGADAGTAVDGGTLAGRMSALVIARAELAALAEASWSVPEAEREAHEARLSLAREAATRALDDALVALGEPGEPPPREAGAWELVLTHGVRGVVGLLDDGVSVRAHQSAADGADAVAEVTRALLPAASIPEGLELRVLASGTLDDVDVAGVALDDGEPLSAHVALSHPLDAAASEARWVEARSALVIVDPTGDLPRARAEGARIAGALRERGVDVTTLTSDEARRAAVLDAMGRAGLLWWSGHGAIGGRDALDSALALAGGDALAIADVLALPRVPRTVVLAGCETGRARALGDAAGLGVGQAFVLAGSERALVTSRPLDDASGEALARALEDEALDALDARTVSRLLERLRAEGVSGWQSVRLVVR